jgi:hypothetical protein
MTVRHWYWRAENASLTLAPSFCAQLGVVSSSQCASGSSAFNSVPTILTHYSHYKYTHCSSLSSNHTHYFSIIYNITRFNYHQYGNDDSNYFSEVHNNNTNFGEILPNYVQTNSYANEVSTFNPIGYYLNYSIVGSYQY